MNLDELKSREKALYIKAREIRSQLREVEEELRLASEAVKDAQATFKIGDVLEVHTEKYVGPEYHKKEIPITKFGIVENHGYGSNLRIIKKDGTVGVSLFRKPPDVRCRKVGQWLDGSIVWDEGEGPK